MHDNTKCVLVIFAIINVIVGLFGIADAYPNEEKGKQADINQAVAATLLATCGGVLIITVASLSE